MNLYAYAGNNPVAFTDPFGLCVPPDSPQCRLIVGVATRVAPLERVVPKLAAAEVVVLAPIAVSMAGGVALGASAQSIGAALQSSSNGLLRAGGLASRLAGAVGGTVTALRSSEGFRVTVEGARNVVARIKSSGDMRVSINRKASLTRDGILSNDPRLTHLRNLLTEELVDLVETAKRIAGILH